ncbi:MAG: alpha-2-macroglobulin family protein, partial [Gemmataceae bacterium]
RGTENALRQLDRRALTDRPWGELAGGLERGENLRRKRQAAEYSPLVVREYAHVRPEGLSAVRADFAETVYWHPVLVLPGGRADVSFQLPDSVTRFQVAAFAHTLDGRLGAATARIDSRLPVSVSPKLPAEVTASDTLLVPVAVASTVGEKQTVTVAVTGHDGLAVDLKEAKLELPPLGTGRVLLPVRPVIREGTATLTVAAGGDSARHTVRVVPDGFPVERSSSDLLEKSATHAVSLPADVIPGSLRARVEAYPSPLADLAKGMEGLLREPSGCFEQTSTTNYPNVLTLDFLRDQKKSSPALEGKARGLLERGYKRLASFECENPAQKSKQGFEWFGGTAPPHEALTAYGLMQFTDMARVADVDPALLARTRAFLLGRKDGKGGFARNPKAMGAFGRASEALTNAYVVWALTETGKDDVTLELDALVKHAEKADDAYVRSLVALSLANRGRTKDAATLLGRVAKGQKPDGSLTAQTSITSSGGVDLAIETTALATVGWLRVDPLAFAKNADLAVRWIGRQRQGGGSFGSTQSTVLALKALLAHSRLAPRVVKEGELKLFVGETEVAKARVPANAEGAITLEVPAPEAVLKAGANKVRVEMTPATNVMPHTVGWSYRVVKPTADAAPLVKLTTKLSKAEVKEGETVRLLVRVENVSGEAQGMATAVIGLPAGLALPENLEQLRGHCQGDEPLVSQFEASGREVVLYWRSLAKGQAVEVPLDVVARVPGTYRGPASRAYLYYNGRAKDWATPLAVTVRE